tara:strand:+ start:189 stop:425 length:237 start_codon:yes stop_codon:yes gene_type:complete
MKCFCSGIFGLSIGVCLCWPGVTSLKKWNCAKDLIKDSYKYNLPIQVVFATPPQYFFKRSSYKGKIGKLRIIGDVCFR